MLFVLAVSLPGCGDSNATSLAEEDLTAEDFAKYEAELEAVTGAEDNEDGGGDDAE